MSFNRSRNMADIYLWCLEMDRWLLAVQILITINHVVCTASSYIMGGMQVKDI